MGDRREIRAKARELLGEVREANGIHPGTLLPAEQTAALALKHLALTLIRTAPDSAHLHGSYAVLEDDVVYVNDDLESGYRQYCVMHEAGHHVLHSFSPVCGADEIGDADADEETPTAKARVIGYGPKEKKEREANLFALELLLPCDGVRKAFREDGLSIEGIAGMTGMPDGFVRSQMARAVLIPVPHTGNSARIRVSSPTVREGVVSLDGRQESAIGTPSGSEGQSREPETGYRGRHDELQVVEPFQLDATQKHAAETRECPALISAGPGTGKTATLIRRIVHLLENGAAPQKILALTFSNKAANEMRERIAEARPVDAAKIPIMTFHSFGFNLLMRYWKEAGIAKDARLLDQVDALLMLEGHLSELKLEHYLALYDPMRDLPDVLTAISVAKDELCWPEEYLEQASRMRSAAQDDEEIVRADKALETAGVYERYQKLMDEQSFLDFGDLILRPAKLLGSDERVRGEVRGLYDHILVDEFQDVNRASGILLKLVAGDGKGLWAVGDLRQSIYRWRGASPANIRQFHTDYRNAKTLSLEVNYRSVEQIVRVFGRFGAGMIAHEDFSEWAADRGSAKGEPVTCDVADRFDTEADAVAERVLEDRNGGTAFRDQAVICRTHAQLAGIGEALAAKGIPVFYLGRLFERPEIRDLLSVIDLASSGNCHALLRLGEFAEYRLSIPDLFAVLAHAGERQCPFRDLDLKDAVPEIGDDSRRKLETIKAHLEHEPGASAYRMLTDYLFSRSAYLKPLLSGDSVEDKQKLIAIFQLLGFARSVEDRFARSENPAADFLGYIKRLVMFREQKNLAEIPAAASGLDAVRLLTVHGAKGLEFGSVHLPYLAAGKVPGRYRGEKCPTPPGLRGDPKDDHDEEEECLFFVAISRARDRLHLSRSIRYSERSQSKASPFLAAIEDVLPAERERRSETACEMPAVLPPEEYERREFYAAELDRYLDCSMHYYYRYHVGLKAGDNRTAYQKLHGIVFETLREVQDSRPGREEVREFASGVMNRLWEEAEIEGHPYADLYREKAEQLLERVIERFGTSEGRLVRKTIRVPLSNGGVKVSADSIEEIGTGEAGKVVARNVKTGKQPASVPTRDADAALLHALRLEYPGADVSVSKVFLTDDSEFPQEISDRVVANRLARYEGAIDGINRGEFEPEPDDFKCPTCSYYFMCQKSGIK